MIANRLYRLLASAVATVVFMLLLVALIPNDGSNRILVMMGGTMPEGLIQGGTYFLFFFGMLEILWLNNKLAHEYESFSAHLLPEKDNWVLSAEDAGTLKLKMQSMAHTHTYQMVDLIKKACTQYRLSKSTAEAMVIVDAQIRNYQAEVESEQSFIRYTAWAIPSVGFIGTVIGIAASLGYAKEAATQEGINKVTDMLAVAFDTTLVALVLSIILMYGIHYLQKREEALYAKMNAYLIENLINRFYK